MKIGDKASFAVTFTEEATNKMGMKRPLTVEFRFTAVKSGAAPYGNESATIMWYVWNNTEVRQTYDTRYSHGKFESVCKDLLYEFLGGHRIENIEML